MSDKDRSYIAAWASVCISASWAASGTSNGHTIGAVIWLVVAAFYFWKAK